MTKNDPVADGLLKTLADSYVTYFKTHAFHWNVTGPHFPALHAMFNTQYDEIWAALDDIAERLREIGGVPPNGTAELFKHASVKEAEGNPKAMEMVKQLLEANEGLLVTIKAALAAAQKAGDEATADLLITRIEAHDKHAWMLRSTLEA